MRRHPLRGNGVKPPIVNSDSGRKKHENEHVLGIGQGEARHGKYKRLSLGGGQAYDRSRDKAAVVA
jgi:hypothetical protein